MASDMNHYENIVEKIINISKTPAADWLANLPLYNCPECNKETIFKEICADCACKDEVENDQIA